MFLSSVKVLLAGAIQRDPVACRFCDFAMHAAGHALTIPLHVIATFNLLALTIQILPSEVC